MVLTSGSRAHTVLRLLPYLTNAFKNAQGRSSAQRPPLNTSQEVSYTQQTLIFIFLDIPNSAREQEHLCRTHHFPLFKYCCDFIKNRVSSMRGRSPFPQRSPCHQALSKAPRDPSPLASQLLADINRVVFKHLDVETRLHSFHC